MENDGFTLVVKKGRRKTHKKPVFLNGLPKGLESRILECQEQLLESKLYTLVTEYRTDMCVCYGIGTLVAADSVWQLSLLLLLKTSVKIWDPVSSDEENEYYKRLGFSLDVDRDCKQRIDGPTLFYMPHCTRQMYMNVIDTNRDQLDKIRLIGNSFDHMELLVEGYTIKELKLPEFEPKSAFHTTSLHIFLK
ncbi:hypothetical protein EDD86DRAFT_197869 [Gorgonomyces haynaldii]|nr:hypothetical protein EDD86DRAFT_197869 [Gorgonomyces haynaldii]